MYSWDFLQQSVDEGGQQVVGTIKLVMEGSEEHLQEPEKEAEHAQEVVQEEPAAPTEAVAGDEGVDMKSLEGHRKMVPAQIICKHCI